MPVDRIRWMNAFFLPAAAAKAIHDACWCPSADVYRTRQGWLVKLDLAGVRPEDLEVSVHGSRLLVRGVRRDWCAGEGCRFYSMEISYSRFERVLELPLNLETAKVQTEYRDGMLLIRIGSEEQS